MSTLLVASTGGHLRELECLVPRLRGLAGPVTWVTNDTAQSRDLLAGQEIVFVPYQGSRNAGAVGRALPTAWRILRERGVTNVISTGSGIALSFLPIAALAGAKPHYVESLTRVQAPSLTGRLLERVPGVACYTQCPHWATPRWTYRGSVLDGFSASPSHTRSVRKVVVTLGTWRQGFRSLVERLVEILPPDVDTVWQTGFTDVSGLPLDATPWLPPGALREALSEADVVVSHAGVGATLDALQAGKCPVLIPRRAAGAEQIDDHQLELAEHLGHRGLALTGSAVDLTFDMLVAAASTTVEVVESLPPFDLAA